MTALTFDSLRSASLVDADPVIAGLLDDELARQRGELELIASENFTWPSVLEAVGSVGTNKYAEGYPGRRYYGGCQVVDEIETIAIERVKELFGAEHANVQPHAGAQANMGAYLAVLDIGDTVMGLRLDQGGHLTHGHKVNFSGKHYNFVSYGVDPETERIDMDEVRKLARRAPAEADRRRRLRVPAALRLRRLPRHRGRGRRAVHGRHGAHRRPRRRRRAPLPRAARRHRHVDHAQDARGPARRVHPVPRRAGQEGRLRRLPRHAGRPADAHHRRQGGLLRGRRHRRVPRLPGAGRGERRGAGRDAHRARPRARLRRHRQPPRAAEPEGLRARRPAGRGPARGLRDHRQPQRRAVRPAPADGHERRPHRHAGRHHARPRRAPTSARSAT